MTQLSFDSRFTLTGHDAAPEAASPRKRGAYPRLYAWVAALAFLDIVLTTMVLGTGGRELNALARWAIEHAGILGMVAIKGTTLAVVLCICEYLARIRPRTGLRVAGLALVANSAAVGCGITYLAQYSIVLLQWM